MLSWTRVCTSLSDTLLSVFWGCRPRSRIAGSHGNVLFNFFSNPHTIFLGNCPILHSASNAQGFPFLHIPTHTSYFLLCIAALLTGVRWYLTVVLICTSLVTSGVEHPLVCRVAIRRSCLEDVSIKALCPFWNQVVFCCWAVRNSSSI